MPRFYPIPVLVFFILFALPVFSQPTISSFGPASGPVGTMVTISGTNFSPAPANNIVYFGAVKATVMTASASALSVVVPAGATYQPITVTVNKLTAYSALPFIITFAGAVTPFAGTSFTSAGGFATATSTKSVAVCDFDGDGKVDMAAAASQSAVSSVSVLRNTSTGGAISFAAKADFATGTSPYQVTTGDIDGDGKQDIVVANNDGNSISVLKNNSSVGTIAFAAKMDLPVVSHPYSVAVGDLDGDGKPDIVAVNSYTTLVSVFRNTSSNGVISFAPMVNYTTGSSPYYVAIGDLDGDGKPELAVANYSSNTVSVYRNTSSVGSVSFAARADFSTGSNSLPYCIAIADVDADGKADLAVSNSNLSARTVSVLKNTSSTGSISFAAKADYATGYAAMGVAASDLDGDGLPDLAMINNNDNSVSLQKNTSSAGSISFVGKTDFAIGQAPVGMAIGDFNGDGKPDIAAANFYLNTVTVLKNTIGSSLQPVLTSFTPATAYTGGTITITGTGFTGATAVTIGGIPAASFSVVSDNTITAVVAAGLSGDVSVTTPNGTVSAPGFVFTAPAPTVTSFIPASGHVGDTILINGTDFTGASGISFGGIPASWFGVISPTVMIAIVGPGATGDVAVTTASGTATLAGFTFIPPVPSITSFTPLAAKKATTVTITGTNLLSTSGVSFGGVPATSFTVVSATTVTAVVGAGASGNVSVTVPGNTASLAGFTFIQPPVISSFTPASGPVGTSVTIAGIGFNTTPSANIVYFGAVKATVTAATSTSLTVTVPTGASYQPLTVTTGNMTGFSAQLFVVTFPGGAGPFTGNSFAAKINTTAIASCYPYKSIAADFDGDGKADVAEVNHGLSSISVFRNTGLAGTISLAAKQDFTTNAVPVSITTGDVDGDGKPDIVVTNEGATPMVSVFLNTSTGGAISFAARADYASGAAAYYTPGGIVVRDLDGDGLADLAIANSNGILAIYRNTGSPGVLSFDPIKTFAIPGGQECLAAADMDGDGKADLLVSNGGAASVSVFRNMGSSGTISFGTRQDFTTGNGPVDIAFGDLDNDGKADIAVANGTDNTVSVLKNTGTAGTVSFAAKADFAAGPTPTGVAIGDLNGDGLPDLAVTNGANNTVYVLRNTSAAGVLLFDPAAGYGTGTYPYSVALNDLDGDGLPDMLIANRDNNNISIIRNTVKAPAVYSFNPQFAANGSVATITGQHFTGATAVSFGGTAAASFTVNTDSTITATIGTGTTGSVAVTTPYGTATLGGFVYTTLPIVRSFTPKRGGPGTTVTLIGNNFTGTTSVKFSTTTPSSSFTVNSDTSITVVAGTMPPAMDSIIVTNAYGTRSTAWFYAGPYITAVTPASGTIGATVTINGNNFSATAANNTVYFGAVKAVVSAATTTSLTVTVPAGATYQPITVMTNNLTAFSQQPFVVTFGPGGAPFTAGSFAAKTDLSTTVFPGDVFSADIDGDGKPDLVEVNQGSNTVSVFRNTGFGSGIAFAARVDFATGSAPFGLTIGDVNGDGKPDLVVTNIDGSASSISVLKNTSAPGTVSFAAKVDYGTGNSIGSYPQSVSISDLDGDGAPDIAAVNSDGTLSLFRNRSTLSSIYFDNRVNYSTGLGPQSVAIGDLDGDGLADIAVANSNSSPSPTLNTISIFRNTSVPGAFSFAVTTYVPTGNGPYSVAIGDLDGDGKLDLAVADANTFFDGVNYNYNVSVIKNTSTIGNISFAPKLDYKLNNYPSWVSIGDMDGDGMPDLVAANRDGGISGTGNVVSVLRNTSSGGTMSFAAKADYATGVDPESISLCDLDGDGKPDIITTNTTSYTISILRNLIAGTSKPTVSSFTPVSAGTGTTVTIRGAHFAGATAVVFGGVPAASYTVVSDTVVTAVVGLGATGVVRVTTPAGTDSLAGFTFIPATPAPKINSFTPTSAATGATVTIKGLHFTGAVSVSFGGVAATSFTVVSDSAVTAVVGTGATGIVRVTTPAGADSLAGFTFIPPATPAPKISSFTPTSAATGATVTIKGLHFTGAVSVSFGGVAATSFTVVSDSAVTAVVGTGATGIVRVTTSAGTDSLAGFTVIPPVTPLHLASFAPASAATGATVIITGIHFTGVTAVSFGGTAAASFTVVSDSLITAVVGTGSTGQVLVRGTSGTDSLAGFTYSNSVLASSSMVAYPNPSSLGYVTVKHPATAGTAQIQLINMAGTIVRTVGVVQNATVVDLTGIEPGIYNVAWSNANSHLTQSILVQ